MPSSTIDTTPSSVFLRNPGRLSLTLRNESGAGQKIYFWLNDAKGLTLAQADYVLVVGEEKNLTWDTDGEDMRNPIAAIADAAGAVLYATDTTIRRKE
jgi:hypothetical protein